MAFLHCNRLRYLFLVKNSLRYHDNFEIKDIVYRPIAEFAGVPNTFCFSIPLCQVEVLLLSKIDNQTKIKGPFYGETFLRARNALFSCNL